MQCSYYTVVIMVITVAKRHVTVCLISESGIRKFFNITVTVSKCPKWR